MTPAPLPTESREYPTRPFAAVGVVVFRDETVLLIRRGNPPRRGEWSLPGGTQNTGETVRETAVREVLEETGVHIGEPRFLEVIDAIIRDESERVRYHYTLIDFQAEWVSGEPSAADDAQHAEFVPLDKLDDLGLWTKTVEVIREARAARYPPGI
ncbi:MAG: NUDIX domain-containing protein [Spirochaetaceae bacterium]|nr:MAG: NUDIX domain-containing protein [Spirochaetaceae bacterium]